MNHPSPLKLQYLERQTGPEPTASIIWLHGLGADGHDFEPIVADICRPEQPLRFIFPHAPMRPVTLNNGMVMRAWYDLYSMQMTEREDLAGINEAADAVDLLIEREIARGIPAARILLAGFSQGGAIALVAGLRYKQPLAGIVALSTYLPGVANVADKKHATLAKPPIMMAHGKDDDVIPLSLGLKSRDQLVGWNYALSWHQYPMGHSVCPAEIADLADWIFHTLAATNNHQITPTI